jgi:predicted nucleotidyltransferase
MKSAEEIKRIIAEYRPFLKEKFAVETIALFGSYSKGEQRKESDIDILVSFSRLIDLFEFVELENYLSEVLGSKVDLVMKDSLKPRIKDSVLKESVTI